MPVYVWGSNSEGKCGVGDRKTKDCLRRKDFGIEKPFRLSTLDGAYVANGDAGEAHTLLLDQYGTVFSFGRNREGQLGHGDQKEVQGEELNSSSSSTAMTNTNQGSRKRRVSVYYPKRVVGLENEYIASVACGSYHSLAITSSGRVYAWGLLVVSDESTENTSGSNLISNTGLAMENLSQPLENNQERTLAEIVNQSENQYLLGDGDWDPNQASQSGVVRVTTTRKFQTTPKLMESLAGYFIIQCSAGHGHTIALSDTGDVLSAGYNDRGQLGNGTRLSSPDFHVIHTLAGTKITEISTGMQHNVALDERGRVWVWGSNSLGQLGITKYVSQGLRRLEPNLLKSLLDVGGFRIRSIACGENHCVAVGMSGEIFSWGHAEYDQHAGCFPPSLYYDQFLPTPRRCIVLEEKIKPHKIRRVHCGRMYNIGITESNRIVSWGWAAWGVLGRDSYSITEPGFIKIDKGECAEGVKIVTGADHCFCITTGEESTIARDFLRLLRPSNDGRKSKSLQRCDSGDDESLFDVTFEVFEKAKTLGKTRNEPLKDMQSTKPSLMAANISQDEVMDKDSFLKMREKMASKFKKMLKQQRGEDVDTSEETSASAVTKGQQPRLFDAHKVIIEARCPVLASVYKSKLEKDPDTKVFQVYGVRHNVFAAILEYLYTDRLPQIPFTFLPHVRRVASRWKLDHLIYVVDKRLNLERGEERKIEEEPSLFENDMTCALGSETNADCIFSFNNITIPVHTCILKRYKFFRTMLCGNFSESVTKEKCKENTENEKCKENVSNLPVVDVSFVNTEAELYEILQYIYTGSLKVIAESSNILALLLIGHKLGMEDLFLRSQEYIISNLNMCEDIKQLEQFSVNFNFKAIEKACIQWRRKQRPLPTNTLSTHSSFIQELHSKVPRRDD